MLLRCRVCTGNWAEIYNQDGSSFFMHTITDEQKDTLTEEEKQHLLPAVDPYNNDLVMPLKVGFEGCRHGQRATACRR